jgi:single-stranded-DNA-specific exonuclease
MKEENFEPFKKHFFEQLKHIPEIERTVQSPYDLVINFQEITPQLIEQLEILEPFGMGNEKPIFRMTDIKIHSYQVLKDLHVKWFFHHKSNPNIKLSGISFNYIGKWNSPLPEEVFQHQESEDITIQFTLGINRFNGNKMIQLMVDEVMIGKHC